MKRLWIAASILVIVIGACVWGRVYQIESINDMIGTLNRIDAARDLSEEDLRTQIEALYNDFEETASVLTCYMNHEDIEGAKSAVVTLRATAHHHDDDEIYAAIETARAQLTKLRDIDSICIQNIM